MPRPRWSRQPTRSASTPPPSQGSARSRASPPRRPSPPRTPACSRRARSRRRSRSRPPRERASASRRIAARPCCSSSSPPGARTATRRRPICARSRRRFRRELRLPGGQRRRRDRSERVCLPPLLRAPLPGAARPELAAGELQRSGRPGKGHTAYRVASYPTFYVLDALGRVYWSSDGEQPDALLLGGAASGRAPWHLARPRRSGSRSASAPR